MTLTMRALLDSSSYSLPSAVETYLIVFHGEFEGELANQAVEMIYKAWEIRNLVTAINKVQTVARDFLLGGLISTLSWP